jgi:hypothetical protein
MPLTRNRVEELFTWRPPSEAEVKVEQQLYARYKHLALEAYDLIPDGPGRTVAVRKLMESLQNSAGAVRFGGKF